VGERKLVLALGPVGYILGNQPGAIKPRDLRRRWCRSSASSEQRVRIELRIRRERHAGVREQLLQVAGLEGVEDLRRAPTN